MIILQHPIRKSFIVIHMDSDLTLDFIIIIALIVANGLFSMTELAIVNARKRKLEEMAEDGNERAKKAFELAENPNQMFSTIQFRYNRKQGIFI